MRSVIAVHPDFEKSWPFTAGRLYEIWKQQPGEVALVRAEPKSDIRLSELVPDPATVTRLVSLSVRVTSECVKSFSGLKEAAFSRFGYGINPELDQSLLDSLKEAGVKVYSHTSEGYWGQSVSEFGLAMTLCALRRIPQSHREIMTNLQPWDFEPQGGVWRPGLKAHQFSDDLNFTNGTVEGKRVRIVGAGNIASRYASFMSMLGADVAAWDPYASEPSFHRAGSRRELYLERLVKDAEIFAPMVPLTDSTRGIVTAEHIRALPKSCLVVLVTRANICDMGALRERVLADELSLAADVFDMEPLPLNDPLLGRHNVVHTPHIAGRTIEANKRWAEMLADKFQPV